MFSSENYGFDFDDETIMMFDSILLAITNDPDIHEEFKKLKFIQVLKADFDESDGPIKQIVQKVAQLERAHKELTDEHTKTQMDLKRAVSDLTSTAQNVRAAMLSTSKVDKLAAVKKLEGLELRQSSYTWNQN